MLRISAALFLLQAGFHAFTASMPLALARAGRPDPEIGLIVGTAALFQIPAALFGGALLDRFGSVRVMVVGGVAYLGASALLLLPGVEPSGSTLPFFAARLLQGVGIGLVLPAGLALAPRLVAAARQGMSLAIAGASHNLALVVMPPLSIVVLDAYGLDGVALGVAAFVSIGLAATVARPFRPLAAAADAHDAVSRRFGFAFRRSWTAPLAIMVLFVAHWGVVAAYLPQRAEGLGANVGLFFAADGAGVLLARVPSGWLADRFAPLGPVLVGIALTIAGLVLLLVPPTTPLLVVAGCLTGGGAALIVTPVLLTLSRRSNEADRGSAFALFSASFALAMAIGSLGAVPIIDRLGFELTLTLGIAALAGAAVVAMADRGLGERVRVTQEVPPLEP